MKPRYYVHMGPKAAEKVSCLWKAGHILIYLVLLISSSIATACIYDILDMYDFHCIIYAKINFEQTFEERIRELLKSHNHNINPSAGNDTRVETTTNKSTPALRMLDYDQLINCTEAMKPRYYVHMGPKAAEKVSCLWKAGHILIYLVLLISSSIATACIYDILDMYDFHCIIYAKINFEQTFEERIRELLKSHNHNINPSAGNDTRVETTTNKSTPALRMLDYDQLINCTEDLYSSLEVCRKLRRKKRYMRLLALQQQLQRIGTYLHFEHSVNETIQDQLSQVNNTGFLNLRKTIFSTIYMCDLMLFAPLASVILSIFLGVVTAIAGKGGAGNPGDLLPNPWFCIYPFLGLCAFMTIFSFIADSLFHNGLAAFCSRYFDLTGTKVCSEKMDQYNVQFTPQSLGPPKPFYMTYFIGSIGVQLTSAFWVIQTLLYIFRIVCLADFSVYLTRIKLKDDEKKEESKMAGIVKMMMDKTK